MVDAIETNPRYRYVKSLADDTAQRAKDFHVEYQEFEDMAVEAEAHGDLALALYATRRGNAKLNDFFYWIGHSNAYRGIALQVDFMETVETELDETPSCP